MRLRMKRKGKLKSREVSFSPYKLLFPLRIGPIHTTPTVTLQEKANQIYFTVLE